MGEYKFKFYPFIIYLFIAAYQSNTFVLLGSPHQFDFIISLIFRGMLLLIIKDEPRNERF